MLLKSFASAALLFASALATPLSITLEIADTALAYEQALLPPAPLFKEKPGKGGTVGPVKKFIDLIEAQASVTATSITELDEGNNDHFLEIVKNLYVQYQLFNNSLTVNPTEKFSEKAGDAVVNFFFTLTAGLKAEFETVVEKKDVILTYGKLDILLADDIAIVEEGWIAYNDALYNLLPTEQQKEDFTDYSAGTSLAISTAKDAVTSARKSKGGRRN